MRSDFAVFGPVHGLLLVGIGLLPWALARATAGRPDWQRQIRIGLSWTYLIGELLWYPSLYLVYGNRFPYGLPFQLCGFSGMAAIVAGLTLRQPFFEFAYYAGTTGAAMALLTPDLFAPAWSYPTVYHFLAHAILFTLPLYLILTGQMRPGGPGRTWLRVNALALPVGLFNWAFQMNYMYLCQKPASGSAMDLLGPWPWYLLALEALAGLLFTLLWLPFRQRPLDFAGRDV